MSLMAEGNDKASISDDIKPDAIIAGGIEVQDLSEPDPSQATRRWELWSYYVYYVCPPVVSVVRIWS